MAEDLITELKKFLCPEIVFGIGARMQAGQYAANLGGSHVLVVTDPGIIAAGWVAQLEESMALANLRSTVFQDVTPNPKDHEVMAGALVYRKNQCDTIVTIGGGSAMDCAKGISIVVSNPGHIGDYEGVDTIPEPGPPLICIPTTSGSAADVSQFAIITDTVRRNKMAIISRSLVPDVALLDPETTVTMDPYLTACTGMDTLTHAIEAYASNAHSPITDLHAVKAIELTAANLQVAHRQPDNLFARQQMMLACLEAGLAFSNASLGLVHSMAHSLGGLKNLTHGECNAILLESVIRFNTAGCEKQYRHIGALLGLELDHLNCRQATEALSDKIYELRKSVGITRRLSDLGVTPEDLAELADKAAEDPCLLTNPRQASPSDIARVYGGAL